MVTVIWQKRALPVYWKFLEKKGSSNLLEQIAVIRPVLRLLKRYEIVVYPKRPRTLFRVLRKLNHQFVAWGKFDINRELRKIDED